ncbi:hypothetical protein ACU5JM_00095 (plasmid) [Rhodococcus erythropolis]|uniref:hypothetical protein n=1 Tax=Rhodococcus erythropolis TaxID=1833 RepID=UPI00406BA8CA
MRVDERRIILAAGPLDSGVDVLIDAAVAFSVCCYFMWMLVVLGRFVASSKATVFLASPAASKGTV